MIPHHFLTKVSFLKFYSCLVQIQYFNMSGYLESGGG